jgi:hypothetical protein
MSDAWKAAEYGFEQASMQRSLALNLDGHPKAEPIKDGDLLETKPFGRVIVKSVSDNINGEVYVAYRLDNGNECVVMEAEVVCRFTH